jgi:hypothetical protein
MLANMSETNPRADMPPVNQSDLGVSELPTGTVTLLLADIEGSTQLWETQPQEMANRSAHSASPRTLRKSKPRSGSNLRDDRPSALAA